MGSMKDPAHWDIHNWVITISTVLIISWGLMAYFVHAEDQKTALSLTNDIGAVAQHLRETERRVVATEALVEVVTKIDRKLAVIENSLSTQTQMAEDIRALRREMHELRRDRERG